MIKFMCKNKGGISIFLAIVLLPMLMFASIFVDMSRISLGKAVAASAGDLALNTALSSYDVVLKDMYGLFATSQNIDELLENLEGYYRKSIEPIGLSKDEKEDFVQQAMSLLRESTGNDNLLNMSLVDFKVNKPDTASVINPAILKSQIVEFMKYRGPINLGLSFFDAINSMKDLDINNNSTTIGNVLYPASRWFCIAAIA